LEQALAGVHTAEWNLVFVGNPAVLSSALHPQPAKNCIKLTLRPLLHALVEQRIKDAFGVELDEVKVSKAEAFLAQSLQVSRLHSSA
jgi:hypothetical protein